MINYIKSKNSKYLKVVLFMKKGQMEIMFLKMGITILAGVFTAFIIRSL